MTLSTQRAVAKQMQPPHVEEAFLTESLLFYYYIYQTDKKINLQPCEAGKWIQLSRLDGGDHIIGHVPRKESHQLKDLT